MAKRPSIKNFEMAFVEPSCLVSVSPRSHELSTYCRSIGECKSRSWPIANFAHLPFGRGCMCRMALNVAQQSVRCNGRNKVLLRRTSASIRQSFLAFGTSSCRFIIASQWLHFANCTCCVIDLGAIRVETSRSVGEWPNGPGRA